MAINEKDFKGLYKPASCSQAPWASLIPSKQRDDVLRAIRKESIALYGEDLSQCPKRKVCLSKTCAGRPVPWDSPTAKPLLDQMKLNQSFNSKNELIISNCETCKISKTCKSTCAQMNDYLNRDKSQEPELIYKATIDSNKLSFTENAVDKVIESNITIPWDSITEVRKKVIQKRLYEQKEFLDIANKLDLEDQAHAKYLMYSGLTTLSEYGIMRMFLNNNKDKLTEKQVKVLTMVYTDNKTMVEVASILKVSKQNVEQIINRLITKFNIKWHIYAKKQGNEVTYFVPESFK